MSEQTNHWDKEKRMTKKIRSEKWKHLVNGCLCVTGVLKYLAKKKKYTSNKETFHKRTRKVIIEWNEYVVMNINQIEIYIKCSLVRLLFHLRIVSHARFFCIWHVVGFRCGVIFLFIQQNSCRLPTCSYTLIRYLFIVCHNSLVHALVRMK